MTNANKITAAINADHARLRTIYSQMKSMVAAGDLPYEDDDGTLQDEVFKLISRMPKSIADNARSAFAALYSR